MAQILLHADNENASLYIALMCNNLYSFINMQKNNGILCHCHLTNSFMYISRTVLYKIYEHIFIMLIRFFQIYDYNIHHVQVPVMHIMLSTRV